MTLPDGWLTDEEANELRRLASKRTVLELGAWKGRSTVVLSETADYVVSVDRHQGISEVGGEDSLPDYLENVRGIENVAIVVASFDEIVPLLGTFGLVYVDGDHDSESAFRDAIIAEKHLAPGGTVAFHDWDFDSVRDGVGAAYRCSPNVVIGSVASFRGRT